MVENSKKRSAKIKAHIEYFNSIREIGVIDACKQGIIKKVSCSVSGGKDSVATLLWAKNNLPSNVDIIGSYVSTPLENIDIENYIQYVSSEIGIKIDIYKYTDEEKEKQKEVKLGIKGMTCTSCASSIGTNLKKMDGVDFAGVNLVDKTALVKYDPKKVDVDNAANEVAGIVNSLKAKLNVGN